MERRDLRELDKWLATAKELNLGESHEAQTVLRLRATLEEDEGILGRLGELARDVEGLRVAVDSAHLDELHRLLAGAAARGFTAETDPDTVGRAAAAAARLQARQDALAALALAVRSADAKVCALGAALVVGPPGAALCQLKATWLPEKKSRKQRGLMLCVFRPISSAGGAGSRGGAGLRGRQPRPPRRGGRPRRPEPPRKGGAGGAAALRGLR